MLNIRRAPSSTNVLAGQVKKIYGNRFVHLLGVNPNFEKCSTPIEIVIDKELGNMYCSILLEDIEPLSSNDKTTFTDFIFKNLPENEPSINYIEEYLDTKTFSFNNKMYDIKSYFKENNIALFYSCGVLVDDLCYAEELKQELREKNGIFKEKQKEKEEKRLSFEEKEAKRKELLKKIWPFDEEILEFLDF